MWPGEQPPGGEQNPQDQSQNPYQQPGYQQPNPYQQPGYQQQPGSYGQQPSQQQPNPYAQQQGAGQQPGQQQPWQAPTMAMGGGQPPQQPGGPGRDEAKRTKITALVAAGAVVVTAAVTGFLVIPDDDDKTAASSDPSASPSASGATSKPDPSASGGGDDNPRGGSSVKPTIPGWKVVVNPKWGTAFDVPADWAVKDPGVFIGFEDDQKGDGSALIGMSAPAYAKEKWCTSDSDHDGQTDDTALGAAGTKGQNGAKNTDDVAQNDSAWWVFGGYTDQKEASKKLLTIGKAKPFTTTSGVKGSVATTYSDGVKKTDKCSSDGKATTFAFKNGGGEFVSWTFYGAKGVKDEIPDETIQKILKTVRLNGKPEE
ncbi:hypothetical protein [Streptomyces sp. NPDC050560]|uniref:hypothetical protein n=1 Tax=Streptomyces sp. NPDC050560 TaxID=3365630 RepID=UPI0037ABE6BB